MANHTASEVAKWFLAYNRDVLAEEGGEYISNLKLQKLLYYAQGSFLAVTDSPLFDDPIVAWQHGPVVESVYHEYKKKMVRTAFLLTMTLILILLQTMKITY